MAFSVRIKKYINVRESKGSESMVEVLEELSNPKYFLVVMKNSDEKNCINNIVKCTV